jgi:insulysin
VIDIQLTEQGISQVNTAFTRCFEAIANIKSKGIPQNLFDEMQKICTMQYQYQSRDDAFDVISDIAYNLVDEPLASYPEKTLIPSSYSKVEDRGAQLCPVAGCSGIFCDGRPGKNGN